MATIVKNIGGGLNRAPRNTAQVKFQTSVVTYSSDSHNSLPKVKLKSLKDKRENVSISADSFGEAG